LNFINNNKKDKKMEKKLYEFNCNICGKPHKSENYRKRVCDNPDCNVEYERIRKEKTKNKVYNRTCPVCNKDFTIVGSKEFCCSKECHDIFYKDKKERVTKTYLKKYGVEHHGLMQSVKDKRAETNLKRYGVENPCHRAEIQKKISKAYLNKSEKQKQEIENKRIKTNLKKYGVEYTQQLKEVRTKSENTMMKRYGSKHTAQCEEIFNKQQKSGLNFKDYYLPSGKLVKVQGYEPQILDELFKTGYKEEDILIHPTQKDIGKIFYRYDEKEHRYYPDIYIKSENKIIEVKSDYYYQRDLDRNELKKKACVDKGFLFEFYIYEKYLKEVYTI
jgi:predicted nucleic acid-binding Zn ribbon protein